MLRFACLLWAVFTVVQGQVARAQQCAIDFDFGDAVIGISPNPEVGEQFEVGVLGEPYYDVLHILLPTFVNDVDESFAFNDDTLLLDSVALSGTSLTNLATHGDPFFGRHRPGGGVQQQRRLRQPLLLPWRRAILR